MMIFLAALPDEKYIPSFTEFFSEYKQLIGKIAYGQVHDFHLAEDCVQEVMLYFAEHFDKVDSLEKKQKTGLVIMLTKQRAINMYNQRQRINQKEQLVSDDEDLDEIFFESDTIDSENSVDELYDAIRKLPEIYSNPLVLKYIYGYSNSEISGLLLISEDVVRKRLERARTKLRLEVDYE